MSALLTAWQAALAAEQEAAFGYALLGPRLPAGLQDAARTCQATHEDIRDGTASAIAAIGAVPVAPKGDYPALYPLSSAPARLAARLEEGCAAGWRYLYSAAASADGSAAARATAQGYLTASAVRATKWRVRAHEARPVVAFPGL